MSGHCIREQNRVCIYGSEWKPSDLQKSFETSLYGEPFSCFFFNVERRSNNCSVRYLSIGKQSSTATDSPTPL